MRRHTLNFLLFAPWLALSACEHVNRPDTSRPTDSAAPAAAATAPIQTAAVPRPTARTAAELDRTTPQQRAEAAAPAAIATEVKLGSTIASLGDPTLPGFWIRTPLVKAPAKGRVHYAVTGKSAKVDLLPLAGPASGGSQLSLPALQLLGISLTDLPNVEVYRN